MSPDGSRCTSRILILIGAGSLVSLGGSLASAQDGPVKLTVRSEGNRLQIQNDSARSPHPRADGLSIWHYAGDTPRSELVPAEIELRDTKGGARIHWAGSYQAKDPSKEGFLWLGHFSQKFNQFGWPVRDANGNPVHEYQLDASFGVFLLLADAAGLEYRLARIDERTVVRNADGTYSAAISESNVEDAPQVKPTVWLGSRSRSAFTLDLQTIAGLQIGEPYFLDGTKRFELTRSGKGRFRITTPFGLILRQVEGSDPYDGKVSVLVDGRPVGDPFDFKGPMQFALIRTPPTERPISRHKVELRTADPSADAVELKVVSVTEIDSLDRVAMVAVDGRRLRPTQVIAGIEGNATPPDGFDEVELQVAGSPATAKLGISTAQSIGNQPPRLTVQNVTSKTPHWSLSRIDELPKGPNGETRWRFTFKPGTIPLSLACRLDRGEAMPPQGNAARTVSLSFNGAPLQLELQPNDVSNTAAQAQPVASITATAEAFAEALEAVGLAGQSGKTWTRERSEIVPVPGEKTKACAISFVKAQRWRLAITWPPAFSDPSKLPLLPYRCKVIDANDPSWEPIPPNPQTQGTISSTTRPGSLIAGPTDPRAGQTQGRGQSTRDIDEYLEKVSVEAWRAGIMVKVSNGNHETDLAFPLISQDDKVARRDVTLRQITFRIGLIWDGRDESFTESELTMYHVDCGGDLGDLSDSRKTGASGSHREKSAWAISPRADSPPAMDEPAVTLVGGNGRWSPALHRPDQKGDLYTWSIPARRKSIDIQVADIPFRFDLKISRAAESKVLGEIKNLAKGNNRRVLPEELVNRIPGEAATEIRPHGPRDAPRFRVRLVSESAGRESVGTYKISGYEATDSPDILLIVSNDHWMGRATAQGSLQVARRGTELAFNRPSDASKEKVGPRFRNLWLAMTITTIDRETFQFFPDRLDRRSWGEIGGEEFARLCNRYYAGIEATDRDIDLPTLLKAMRSFCQADDAQSKVVVLIVNYLPHDWELPLDVVRWLREDQTKAVHLVYLDCHFDRRPETVRYRDHGRWESVPLKQLFRFEPIVMSPHEDERARRSEDLDRYLERLLYFDTAEEGRGNTPAGAADPVPAGLGRSH